MIVRAVIGHDERLLVVRQRGEEHWFLPGGHVERGEPAEAALGRELNEELNATLRSASFLALVEHGYTDRTGANHHELNLIFDVTLMDPDVYGVEDHLESRWMPWDTLGSIDLRPAGLRAGLLSNRFDQGDRWLPWQPA